MHEHFQTSVSAFQPGGSYLSTDMFAYHRSRWSQLKLCSDQLTAVLVCSLYKPQSGHMSSHWRIFSFPWNQNSSS